MVNKKYVLSVTRLCFISIVSASLCVSCTEKGSPQYDKSSVIDWLESATIELDELIFSSMIDNGLSTKSTHEYEIAAPNGDVFVLSAYVDCCNRSAYVYTKNGRIFALCIYDHRPGPGNPIRQWKIRDVEIMSEYENLL